MDIISCITSFDKQHNTNEQEQHKALYPIILSY